MAEPTSGTASRKHNQLPKVIVATAVIVLLVVTGVLFYTQNQTSSRSITAIEKAIPADAGLVMVSKYDKESLDYFTALAGLETQPKVSGDISHVGVALLEGVPYFYLDGGNVTNKKILKQTGLYLHSNNGITSISVSEANMIVSSKDSIAQQDKYQEKASDGSDISFGYINFPALPEPSHKKLLNMVLPSLGVWTGGFVDGHWEGTVSNVNMKSIDVEKASFETDQSYAFNDFLTNMTITENDENTYTGSFYIENYNRVAYTDYPTILNKVYFSLDGKNLSFSLEK